METPLGRLEKVELRDYWKDEARDFTTWLAEDDNIYLLGETVGMELEIQDMEAKVGNFSADILCKDINTDRRVVIENQLDNAVNTDPNILSSVYTLSDGDPINRYGLANWHITQGLQFCRTCRQYH